MFDFRIISLSDGNQVIDRNHKTPYSALTPVQMVEYVEVDVQLAVMDEMNRKARLEREYRRKREGNLLYRLACICGLA